MPADAPANLIALLAQPVVAEHLRVEVMGLERRVVHVRDWAFEEEEGVVVDERGSAIDAREGCYIAAGRVVEEVAGEEVEAGCVEGICFCEVGHDHAEVAEFVDGSRAWVWDPVSECLKLCLLRTHASLASERCLLVSSSLSARRK